MSSNKIKIEYNGEYPNLCSGQLIVTIGKKRWKFPSYCLLSGGSVWFDDDWGEHVESGEWSVSEWPDRFPEDRKADVIDAINSSITLGCCGGCV
jgi:hypothetical protein